MSGLGSTLAAPGVRPGRSVSAVRQPLSSMNSEDEGTTGLPSIPARTTMPDWYAGLLDSISQHISTGHRRAVRAANQEVLATYWAIGREILHRQGREGWAPR